ncbi:3'-tRNA processing endoribonuclease [Zalerion maritima]|uniref:3'-tRNA processing endoribonuclease n=1 Tax=Zalerion maritima TaxID=339359 RepID=A0AAD5RPK2_9PEZI|nr:3'-tRNA processing endoribonuclease [Zalerion maritima]
MAQPTSPPSYPPSPSPTFATPLPQSPRSSILEYRFPSSSSCSNLVLLGKSRAAWHTSFVIPQLNLLLDAGLCINHLRPKHVFLTHGHNDHTAMSTAFVKRENNPDFYCPKEMTGVFDGFILANTLLNLGGEVGVDDEEFEMVDGRGEEDGVEGGGSDSPGSSGGKDKETGDWEEGKTKNKDKRHPLLNTHHTHGLSPGDVVELPRLPAITATAFKCDHSVPCLGYVFSRVSQRLKPEFQGLPGKEIARLRKEVNMHTNGNSNPGKNSNSNNTFTLTESHSTPLFAFLGDTTASTLAAEPEWLRNEIPVVITECSFLYEEHRPQAQKTKHTLWSDLEPVVRKFAHTKFVVTHFSLRYSEQEIRDFFRGLKGGCLQNLVVWVDGGGEL